MTARRLAPRTPPPSTRHRQAPPRFVGEAAAAIPETSDGAIVERLVRMRAACQALASELAGTRRQLKVVEAELRRLKQRR
jgi:hypothetical protein